MLVPEWHSYSDSQIKGKFGKSAWQGSGRPGDGRNNSWSSNSGSGEMELKDIDRATRKNTEAKQCPTGFYISPPPPLKFSPPSRPRGKMFYKNYWYKRSWSSELQLRIIAEYKTIIASTYQNMPIHRFQFSACLSWNTKKLKILTTHYQFTCPSHYYATSAIIAAARDIYVYHAQIQCTLF